MEQRNLLLAVVLSVAILLTFNLFFEPAPTERAPAPPQQTTQPAPGETAAVPPGAPPVGAVPSLPSSGPQARPQAPSRESVIGRAARIKLASKRLHGSIAIEGARIDDLTLPDYRERLEKDSPEITLLSPAGTARPYFADFGWWAPPDLGMPVAGNGTKWQADRTRLAPDNPVTLTWDNGQGLVFTQVIAVDDDYMFTVTQRVRNDGARPVTLYPWGRVSRTGTGHGGGSGVPMGGTYIHEGPVGVLDGTLEEIDYDTLKEDGDVELSSTGGWLGIKDQYWLVALVPGRDRKIAASFRFDGSDRNVDKYQVGFIEKAGRVVAPGATVEVTNRLFAGAKEVRLLNRYMDAFGIEDFHMAIDYTKLFFLTIPMHKVLLYFYGLLGNYGLAILLLTVLIKLAFFPLANKSYRAMSRLKKLQPKMLEIRETYKDDRARQNQEMMALYKAENANPMAGCLPILIQIPVFISLYIVLFVTIEMRHAPFFGWIHDLSAADPTGILFGFGFFPWDIPDILQMVNIGIWPLIMGGTMFLQQKLNPQPADPTQAKIFMMLPIVFTFLLGRFPAGLVIYWAWNNLLSILQQWVIMRRMGVTASGQAVPAAKGGGPAKAGGPARSGGPAKSGGEAKAGGSAKAARAANAASQSKATAVNRGAAKGERSAKRRGSGKRKRARKRAS